MKGPIVSSPPLFQSGDWGLKALTNAYDRFMRFQETRLPFEHHENRLGEAPPLDFRPPPERALCPKPSNPHPADLRGKPRIF